ncbi:MAG: 16S rRNA (cytidine(1402)-2'-O)-methyltransferase [Chloroherpetonaceae bacterium]|nr:16S rRNA (cytidine(1402)-2'-O)-methyltransferase [Chloroherpetonaceae bacterium]
MDIENQNEKIEPALYVVATPIGNLEDITLRAIKTLKSVTLIACEDTRESLKLLRHFGIEGKALVSYHNFNERGASERILTHIENGEAAALISDAGTPSISDPGFILIREAHKRNLRVIPIPGVSAAVAALSACPIPCNRFTFEGFLPHKKGRQTRLQLLAGLESAIVFYESPHRVMRLLEEIDRFFGNRDVMIARELTKKFEEIRIGKASELASAISSKKTLGEFVLIVAGKNDNEMDTSESLGMKTEEDIDE